VTSAILNVAESMGQADMKTFRELRDEVILRELCGKCGGCVSFCSADELHALEMGADGLPRYADEDKCLACGICYIICPLTTDLDTEVQTKFEWAAPIGPVQAITSARATDAAIRKEATDGGVVTALLAYLLDKHLVDGAIVSRKTTPFSREPMIATTREELITAAGSHFAGSSHLEELGDSYTTYSPTVATVRGLRGRPLRHVAMVGTPCQIKTVRKMQCLGILPAHIISFTVGLLCMENFSFHGTAREKLESRLGTSLDDIEKLNIKDDVIISLKDGTTIHMPFEDVEEMARPACLACLEFANDFADISVGGLGSPDGYTTVLIRTERASKAFSEALRQGYIETRPFKNASELSSEKTKMMAKVVAFARQKRERGEARRAELSAVAPKTGQTEQEGGSGE